MTCPYSLKKGSRGGISYIAKGYSNSNNKYMENYNPKKPSKLITYLDMNNLYGWSMSSYLPCHGFKLLKNVDGFNQQKEFNRVYSRS